MRVIFTWFIAFIWAVVLVGIFLPLIGIGYALRAIGTILCNAAFKLQAGMEWLGDRIAHQLPS